MKKYLHLIILFFSAVACVSQSKYNSLEADLSRLEKDYKALQSEFYNLHGAYSDLKSRYEELDEEYDNVVSDYSISEQINKMENDDKDRRLDAFLNYVNKQNERIAELTTYLERVKYLCTIWNDETSRAIKRTLEDYSSENYY